MKIKLNLYIIFFILLFIISASTTGMDFINYYKNNLFTKASSIIVFLVSYSFLGYSLLLYLMAKRKIELIVTIFGSDKIIKSRGEKIIILILAFLLILTIIFKELILSQLILIYGAVFTGLASTLISISNSYIVVGKDYIWFKKAMISFKDIKNVGIDLNRNILKIEVKNNHYKFRTTRYNLEKLKYEMGNKGIPVNMASDHNK